MKKFIIIIVSLLFIFVNYACKQPEIDNGTTIPVIETTVPVIETTVIPIKFGPPKDRCNEYLPEIRAQALKYIGLDYPYWYNVGSAMAESSCRGSVATSFDGGIGLFQLTPSTGITKEISKFIPVDPYNTESNIRAQAYYIHRIITSHFKRSDMTIGKSKYPFNPKKHIDQCGLNLADVYRFYNSGYWFFAEANIGPLVCSNNEMAEKSVRGGACVGKQYISFGKTSYSYPIKTYNYAKPYKGITEGPWVYWYIESDKELLVKFPIKTCP